MQAEIGIEDGAIRAKIPWANGEGPDWARKVPGAKPRYEDEKFLGWYYPLTLETCRTFRRVFGPGLRVRRELGQWARLAVKAGDVFDDLRSGHTVVRLSRTEEEAPFLAAAISDRPYQGHGVGFMTLAGQCILGDDPGLGKTLQAISTLIETDCKDVIVACPRTATRATWEREVERWAPTFSTFVAQGTRKQREDAMTAYLQDRIDNPEERRILIINNEMVRSYKRWQCTEPPFKQRHKYKLVKPPPPKRKLVWDPPLPVWRIEPGKEGGCMLPHEHRKFVEHEWPFLFRQKWDAVIIDESHNLLASQYNVQSRHITQGRLGAMLLRRQIRPGGLAIALSATPSRSKLLKLWGTLNWCRPDVFTTYWGWAGTHFGVVDGKFGRVVAGGDKVPKPIDKDAWDEMLRPYILAREKQAAAPDLPPIQYTGTPHPKKPDGSNYVFLEMDDRQARAYAQMKKLAEARIRHGNLSAIGTLSEITRLRQLAISYGKMVGEDFYPDLPSNKWDWILNFLEEHEGCDGKYLLASNFTKLINLLKQRLDKAKIRSLTLTGGTSDKGRVEMVRRFNDPDDLATVGIINTKAGGVSVTLDAVCDDLILIDPTWTSDEEDQVSGRLHRVSRIHQVFAHRLVTVGTVEEWMVLATQEQKAALTSARPSVRREAALEAVTWPG